jgi:hypothetical protein
MRDQVRLTGRFIWSLAASTSASGAVPGTWSRCLSSSIQSPILESVCYIETDQDANRSETRQIKYSGTKSGVLEVAEDLKSFILFCLTENQGSVFISIIEMRGNLMKPN